MKNILLTFSYDGTDYRGYQRQNHGDTIQSRLERALHQLYRMEIKTVGAGRTDAGVHARGQAASFSAPELLPTSRLPRAMNTLLPEDITVTGAWEVETSFHARYSAIGKRYTYTIDNARFPQPLERLYSWHCPEPLDLELMERASRVLTGTRDFKEFQAAGSGVQNTVRTLWEIKVNGSSSRNLVRIEVCGDGFLYKMVRFLAGALVRVARERLSVEELQEVLSGNGTRKWEALPGRGLCLEEVYYSRDKIPGR